MDKLHDFIGELTGTFIIVFFGCGSVAVTILFSAHMGLFQIAAIWGIAVTLAIYASRHLSFAHLNPAVSIAMVASGRMTWRWLPVYLGGQFVGAFFAAVVLYGLFSGSIEQFEALNNIVRGTPESIKTAMMFGEFYPNPGAGNSANVTLINAIFAEAIGTYALVFLIFFLTDDCNIGKPDDSITPLFIGLTVAIIICIIAPLTQAGLNPARDLSPRIFSYLLGWGDAAFPDKQYGFFTVYVMGPILGGIFASLTYTKVVLPLMRKKVIDDNGATCCIKPNSE